MFKEGTAFSVTSRPTKDGRVFYVRFKDANGDWLSAKSSRIEDTGKKRDRQAAVAWAQNYLDSGQIVIQQRATVGLLADGFFAWDSDFSRLRAMRRRNYSELQATKLQYYADSYIVPILGNKRLQDVDGRAIDGWLLKLREKGLAGSTINKAIFALRFLLHAAFERKLIRTVPPIGGVQLGDQLRGAFTPEEVGRLFAHAWAEPDRRTYLANLLGATTGMRSGEIAALTHGCIHADGIDVLHTWSPEYGFLPTKNRRDRFVPITPNLLKDIKALMESNPYPGDRDRFLFYGPKPDKPMSQDTFTRALYRALDGISIKEPERKRRGLCFHSHRHTLNTLLVDSGIPLPIIQSIVGHLDNSMTQRYFHAGGRSLVGIRELQAGITGEILPEVDSSAKLERQGAERGE
jgi:integrase